MKTSIKSISMRLALLSIILLIFIGSLTIAWITRKSITSVSPNELNNVSQIEIKFNQETENGWVEYINTTYKYSIWHPKAINPFDMTGWTEVNKSSELIIPADSDNLQESLMGKHININFVPEGDLMKTLEEASADIYKEYEAKRESISEPVEIQIDDLKGYYFVVNSRRYLGPNTKEGYLGSTGYINHVWLKNDNNFIRITWSKDPILDKIISTLNFN